MGRAAVDREAVELSRDPEPEPPDPTADYPVRPLSRRSRDDFRARILECELQRSAGLRDLITSDFLSSGRSDIARTDAEEKVRPTIVFRLCQGGSRMWTPWPGMSKETTASPCPSTRCPWAIIVGVEPAGGRARDRQGGQPGDLRDGRGSVTVRADPDSVHGSRTAARRPRHDLLSADGRRRPIGCWPSRAWGWSEDVAPPS